MNRIASVISFAVFMLIAFQAAKAQSSQVSSQIQATPAAQPVPAIDGGLGRCSLEFSITMPDGKPAGAASVKVHIAYGFGGFHKLDLEAGANSDGKVKFTGLPSTLRRPPLEFRVSKDQLEGTATYDPATECHATREVKLAKPVPAVQ